jgi:ABC-type branched-subunit amino acid transport system substrate-binding protein
MEDMHKGLLYIATVLLVLIVALASFHYKDNIQGHAVRGYVIKDFSGNNIVVPDDVITIGVITPLTGQYAFIGKESQVGFWLAQEDVERMFNRKVHIIYKDSACDPTIATIAAQNLMAEGAEFIIGADCYSRNPLVVEGVVLNMNPSKDIENSYSFSFSSPVEDEFSALFEKVKPIPASLAVIFPDDDYGVDSLAAVKKVYGGNVVSAYKYGNQQDAFADIAGKSKARNNEAVLIIAHEPNQLRKVLKALREAQYENTILTNVGISDAYLTTIGTDAYDFEDVTFVTDLDFLSSRTKTQEFIARSASEYGVEPTTYTANAYDSLMILGEMIKKTGEDPVAVGDAMHNLYNHEGVTGIMTMNQNSLTRTWYVRTIRDGKVIVS